MITFGGGQRAAASRSAECPKRQWRARVIGPATCCQKSMNPGWPACGHLPDAVVEPLVPAAQEQDPRLRRQLLHRPLREPLAGGREHHQLAGRLGLRPHRLDAVDHRLRPSAPSRVRRRTAGRPPAGACPASSRGCSRCGPRPARPGSRLRAGSADVALEDAGEQRQHVEADHVGHRSASASALQAPSLRRGRWLRRPSSRLLRRPCLRLDLFPLLHVLLEDRLAVLGRPRPTLCQYLMRRAELDAACLVRRRAGRRCRVPRSPGRRAAGGGRWRRCGSSAGASGPSASFGYASVQLVAP